MSVIQAALKKAEQEQRKRLEPYNLSIDDILEIAQRKAKGMEASAPAPVVSIKRGKAPDFSPKVFLMAAAGTMVFFGLIFSIGKHLSSSRSEKISIPVRMTQKADGLKKNSVPMPPALREAVTSVKDFYITGVISSGGRWNAMINNKLVEVGSRIDGAKVVEIYEGAATLEHNGKRFTIYLD